MADTYVWSADIRTFVMASCAHGLKLGEELGHRLRPLFWCMLLAIVVSLVGSVAMILHLAYEYGGINLNSWFFGMGTRAPFDYITTKLNTPTLPNISGWVNTLCRRGHHGPADVGTSDTGVVAFAPHRLSDQCRVADGTIVV